MARAQGSFDETSIFTTQNSYHQRRSWKSDSDALGELHAGLDLGAGLGSSFDHSRANVPVVGGGLNAWFVCDQEKMNRGRTSTSHTARPPPEPQSRQQQTRAMGIDDGRDGGTETTPSLIRGGVHQEESRGRGEQEGPDWSSVLTGAHETRQVAVGGAGEPSPTAQRELSDLPGSATGFPGSMGAEAVALLQIPGPGTAKAPRLFSSSSWFARPPSPLAPPAPPVHPVSTDPAQRGGGDGGGGGLLEEEEQRGGEGDSESSGSGSGSEDSSESDSESSGGEIEIVSRRRGEESDASSSDDDKEDDSDGGDGEEPSPRKIDLRDASRKQLLHLKEASQKSVRKARRRLVNITFEPKNGGGISWTPGASATPPTTAPGGAQSSITSRGNGKRRKQTRPRKTKLRLDAERAVRGVDVADFSWVPDMSRTTRGELAKERKQQHRALIEEEADALAKRASHTRITENESAKESGAGSDTTGPGLRRSGQFLDRAVRETAHQVAKRAVMDRPPADLFARSRKKLLKCASRDLRRDQKKRKCKTLYEGCVMSSLRFDRGAKAWADYQKSFTIPSKFSLRPNQYQREFLNAILQSAAPYLMGKDYRVLNNRLLDELGRTDPAAVTLFTCPRRFGKTMVAAMAAATILCQARGVKIAVFSTGQSMANTFMQMVKGFFLELDPEGRRVVHESATEFGVSAKGGNSTLSRKMLKATGKYNQMVSRAATVSGNRGISADIIILEEAAFIPADIIHTALAPLVRRSNCIVLALSTLDEEGNIFTDMCEKDDEVTDKYFVKVQIKMECDSCIRKGKKPGSCKHREHLRPEWILGSRDALGRKFAGDDEANWSREMLGIVMSNKSCVFQPRWLVGLAKRKPRPVFAGDVCFLETMVDTASGSKHSSRTAVCTVACMRNGEKIIVGLAEKAVGLSQVREMFADYLGQIKAHPVYGGLPHFISVENNYGGDWNVDTVLNAARRTVPGLPEYRTHADKPGCVTHNANKNGAVTSMIFDMRDEKINFARDFITIDLVGDAASFDKKRQQVKDAFVRQCRTLHKEITPSGLTTYTGKTKGKEQDDMIICYLFAAFYSTAILVELKKSAQKNREGHNHGVSSAILDDLDYGGTVARRRAMEPQSKRGGIQFV